MGGEEGLCVSTCWGTQNQGGLSIGGVEDWAIAGWTRVAKWIGLFGSLQPQNRSFIRTPNFLDQKSEVETKIETNISVRLDLVFSENGEP